MHAVAKPNKEFITILFVNKSAKFWHVSLNIYPKLQFFFGSGKNGNKHEYIM